MIGSVRLKHTKRPFSKKSNLISIIIVLLLVLFFTEFFDNNNSNQHIDNEEIAEISNEFNGHNPDVLPQLTLMPIEVDEVVDGDTIRATLFGEKVNIRYLMVNTPEVDHDNPNASEPYAEEAKALNQSLLDSADQVYLELDLGPATDNYDRILGYVYADDTFVLEEIVASGLGTVRYVNPPNNSYENQLRNAEDEARAESINLWK